MLYALLCYNPEEVVYAWTKAEDDAVMARLDMVHQRLLAEGKMGPSLRLLPTTAATTLRKTDPPMVIEPASANSFIAVRKDWFILRTWLPKSCGKRSRIGSLTRLAINSSTIFLTSALRASPSAGCTVRLPLAFTSK